LPAIPLPSAAWSIFVFGTGLRGQQFCEELLSVVGRLGLSSLHGLAGGGVDVQRR
jgi:hypothetical protein